MQSELMGSTVTSPQADLSQFGYTYTWPSEEGWFVAPSYANANGDNVVSYYNKGNVSSVEECASFCSNKKGTPGGTYSTKDKRCFCDKSLECLEPVIIERGSVAFSSIEKPDMCAKSFCDYFPEFDVYCEKAERRTNFPSMRPTKSPTKSPTKAPTTSKPTHSPTTNPTSSPTNAPVTSRPTYSPTKAPLTYRPTISPTKMATTSKPSSSKLFSPPTKISAESPTTKAPIMSRTTPSPSKFPTKIPTQNPTYSPTKALVNESPNSAPSKSPTASPVTAVTSEIQGSDDKSARDGVSGTATAITASNSPASVVRMQGILVGTSIMFLFIWLTASM